MNLPVTIVGLAFSNLVDPDQLASAQLGVDQGPEAFVFHMD